MLGQPLDQLGLVTNLTLGEDTVLPNTFLLGFYTPRVEQRSLRLTAGAARMMWLYLTQFLCPASVSLTAPEAVADSASNPLPVVSSVTMEECSGDILEVIALGIAQSWDLRFSREEGHHLWIELDQALRNLPMKNPPVLFRELSSA